MNMKKLRVGVVGAGYLGRFHAEKYARMNDVELVGVVDIDESQAETVAGKFNTKAYSHHEYLFGKVDAVSIVVPTPAHFSVAKDFLENNIDVLIEKPMSETIEQADELIRFAKSRSLIIQVGHLERFNPAVVALRDIIKQPMFIESHRLSIYKDRCADVSVVLDLMIHDIDIILNFVRSEIVNIHAAGVPVISGHVDIANARLEFKSGCIANVTASRISTKNERKIRLFQKDTYISVDFANQGITVIQRNNKIEGGLIPGMEIKQLSFAKSDALEDELKSFVKTVRTRENPEVTGQMGRDALKIALSIMKQIRDTNRRFLS
jgi:predicted dehydrogenase